MELLSVIRRWHYRDQLSIREIARRTGLSRNTVRKYLRSDSVEPRFKALQNVRASSIRTPTNSRRCCASRRVSRASRSARSGSCIPISSNSAMGDRIIGWRPTPVIGRLPDSVSNTAAAVASSFPLTFMPGEAFQFDWSEDWAIIAGERTKLQVAHVKLSYSRAFILRAYLLQTHEMLFDAHNHAFRVLGGVPQRGIYDNMKTAVDKIGRGKQRQVNIRFSAMVSHYLFKAEFCNPASGWEKGQIEKNVQDARHRLWQPAPSFPSLEALNDWLERRCREAWTLTCRTDRSPGTIADVWADEVRHLMAAPRPFDGFVEHTKRVSPTCLVHLERNRYSVPASFANQSGQLCVFIPTGSSSSLKDRRSANTVVSLRRSHDHRERNGLRLAPLLISRAAQTRCLCGTAHPLPICRTAFRLPAAAPAQDARWRSRDGRDPGPGAPA